MPAEADWVPLLKALADATRLRILRALLEADLSVNELAERLDTPQYNISKHLRVLREAGIVAVEPEGASRRHSVALEFRRHLARNENVLDLGCCVFRFNELPE